MRLSNIILRISDMDASVAFWRDQVGLDLLWTSGEFAFFGLGDCQLVLNRPEVYESQRSDTEIVLEVDDPASTHAEMSRRGVPFEVEPRPVTSDGERTLLAAHFRDPDGHLASLTGWVQGVED
jgi:catechol 2,3-dioxygenase-like lactoylglutathione lyase family enzyme